mmetsp:Transcript_9036/g.19243  ORF Transcript_9036/g.19243 Transcript_9036/m.19243 type:complete len:259 (-) Transcript_9036:378-1154(-)|eukprot:CAMPEP_0171331032 /NCGR_PEP_ID=MMETSP0878-20121228/2421_1 /TAXON_ID=67004 /ORGANISM="Thalassiosira weissflogii, Strain CCMP1336" /LENGTH=258 /DNA_ID=CAMNT_0011831471 /DNA_START=142 /DNA_END=918 /DNA_ORIENTATION=-
MSTPEPQSIPNNSEHSTHGATTPISSSTHKRSSLKNRRSSLFAAARASFHRTRGQSGASVETLRGSTGADFEGYATVHRGAEEGFLEYFDLSNLFSCGKKKEGLYFILIKGFHCFVFKDEEAKSPKYAIELMNRKAVVQPSHASYVPRVPHPGVGKDATYTSVHLETSLGDVEYKFTFANEGGKGEMANRFSGAVTAASNNASTEQVRTRLGHGGLLNKRSSVRYANQIGKAKAKDQPEAPLTSGEVLAGMPTTETYA